MVYLPRDKAERKNLYVYNDATTKKSYKETESQPYPYTTGVPAESAYVMIQEMNESPVYNVEEFDPDRSWMPEQMGLPWHEDLIR